MLYLFDKENLVKQLSDLGSNIIKCHTFLWRCPFKNEIKNCSTKLLFSFLPFLQKKLYLKTFMYSYSRFTEQNITIVFSLFRFIIIFGWEKKLYKQKNLSCGFVLFPVEEMFWLSEGIWAKAPPGYIRSPSGDEYWLHLNIHSFIYYTVLLYCTVFCNKIMLSQSPPTFWPTWKFSHLTSPPAYQTEVIPTSQRTIYTVAYTPYLGLRQDFNMWL